jgi:hypothetical protein
MKGPSLTDESTLAGLLVQWQRLRAEGREVAPAHLCAERPDLLPELQRRIAALQPKDALPKHTCNTLGLPPSDPPQDATLAEGANADAAAKIRQEITAAGGPVSALLLRWQEQREQGVTLSA